MSSELTPFLRIQEVEKKFGDFVAVDKISIDIQKGDIFALLGSSGCGKSTLLRMLAGFETPTSGKIFLDGQDISNVSPHLRPINMMFQSYALFPHLSVWDNIAFGLRRDGLSRDVVAQKVEAMLTLTQLTKLSKRKPHQLSGGQQQRVALARSLAKEPKLLLLDEPLGALDKKLRESTQIELVNIIEKVGVTCVMVTHDQEEAMTMASRIAVMSEGRFLQVGSPREIYETPQSEFVADFIGNVNLFEGEITVDTTELAEVQTADVLHVIDHAIAGQVGGNVTIAIRPEKMDISRNESMQRGNQVKGVIKEIAYYGSDTLFHVKLASTGKMIKVQATNTERYSDEKLTWEDVVYVSWTSDAIVPVSPSYS